MAVYIKLIWCVLPSATNIIHPVAIILPSSTFLTILILSMEDKKENAEDLKDSLLSQEVANPSPEVQAESVDDVDLRFDGLNKTHFWAYGVGHFVNDLVAAVWFNYLFYYLKKVVVTEAASAAILAGQIVDGLATPTVGLLSDKTKTRFGQRKPWYVLGLIMVIVCYIPIYSGFKSTKGAEYAWYTIFPSLFNFGWASLQISHMSLVPSLTCSRKRRDKLNNLRNSFTFISNLTVLGLGLIIFSVMEDKFLEYRLIAYTVLAIGTVAAIFFIVKINENDLTEKCRDRQHHLREVLRQQKENDRKALGSEVSIGSDSESDAEGKVVGGLQKKKESVFDWFKMPKFYLFGVCYMSVRMYTNLFGTLLPFYLIDVVGMGTKNKDKISYNIALIPMLAYLSSVLMSLRLNWFYNNIGRKKALFLGTAICLVCLASMAFLKPTHNWLMYPLSLFIGKTVVM